MVGICAFCEQERELRESHVLPAFVYRWLRARSGTGYIRQTDNPNRRVQDGLKLPWLCGDCESKFSRYETAFSTNIFYPWNNGKSYTLYDERLLKFCVSISWRVIKYAYGRNVDSDYSDAQIRLVELAKDTWKKFINDEVAHPGCFEQHILIFDVVENTTAEDLPDNFNRFMTGAVTFDLIGSDKTLLTFAKLGRFMIFGVVQKGPDQWANTKVHVKHGVLQPGEFTIPYGLLDLFKQKAGMAKQAMARVSAGQKQKIQAAVMKDPGKFAKSDQFRAITADAEMFGLGAILYEDDT